MSAISFLDVPQPPAEAASIFAEDVADVGYVMNTSRVWSYRPDALTALFDLIDDTTAAHGLTFRDRAVLIAASASTIGDSYCSLAWGSRLAQETSPDTAAGVLQGRDDGLTERERAMAVWARRVARSANATSESDVQELRDAGFSDAEVFGLTLFVALRIAFATVNDALGVRPDAQWRATAPPPVLKAVTFGRTIADGS